MKLYLQKWLMLIIITLFPTLLFAAVQEWKILPKESNLSFTAIQNDSPVSGSFTKFDGNIAFDPNQLNESHVKIIVDIASLKTSYSDLTETLATSDWFNTAKFSQAIFEAKQFKKIADNQYEAISNLTIRNITLPIKLTFIGDDFKKSTVMVKGNAQVKRTVYQVGQGEWSSTKEIKDEVKIDFTLSATKK